MAKLLSPCSSTAPDISSWALLELDSQAARSLLSFASAFDEISRTYPQTSHLTLWADGLPQPSYFWDLNPFTDLLTSTDALAYLDSFEEGRWSTLTIATRPPDSGFDLDALQVRADGISWTAEVGGNRLETATLPWDEIRTLAGLSPVSV